MIALSAHPLIAQSDPNFAPVREFSWVDMPAPPTVAGTFDVADILGPEVEGTPVQMPPDGWPDVVVITWRSLIVLRNSQVWPADPNNPAAATSLVFHRALSTPGIHHKDVKLVDVNDDRKRDIVTAGTDINGAVGRVRIYLNNNNGTFGIWDPNNPSTANAPTPNAEFQITGGDPNEPDETMWGCYGLSVVNVDGDPNGVREIVVSGDYGQGGKRPCVGVAFRPANGWSNTAPQANLYADPDLLVRCMDIVTGPYKNPSGTPGNTLPDFVASFHHEDELDGLAVGRNTGSGGTFTPTNPMTTAFGVAAGGMVGARFRNALAYNDVVQVGKGAAAHFVPPLKNNGDGTFDELDPITIDPSDGSFCHGIGSGFLNADGYVDVAVAARCLTTSCTARGLLIYRGDGALGFTATPFKIGTDRNHTYVKAFDVNRDCVQDLLTVQDQGAEMRVYLNLMLATEDCP